MLVTISDNQQLPPLLKQYDILKRLNGIVASPNGMAAEDATPSDQLVNERLTSGVPLSPCLAVSATNVAVPTM